MVKDRNERRGNRPIEVRADDEMKARIRVGARNMGSDVSKVTKGLWAWWLGDTDDLPERPKESTVITTEYGSWGNYDNHSAIEDSVADYLAEFADDYDVAGLTDAFRDAINEQLGDIHVALRGSEFYGPYPVRDDAADRVKAAIEAVDLGVLAEKFDRSADDGEG